jgi:hypothetical protein
MGISPFSPDYAFGAIFVPAQIWQQFFLIFCRGIV